jgi:hypothetical protein
MIVAEKPVQLEKQPHTDDRKAYQKNIGEEHGDKDAINNIGSLAVEEGTGLQSMDHDQV